MDPVEALRMTKHGPDMVLVNVWENSLDFIVPSKKGSGLYGGSVRVELEWGSEPPKAAWHLVNCARMVVDVTYNGRKPFSAEVLVTRRVARGALEMFGKGAPHIEVEKDPILHIIHITAGDANLTFFLHHNPNRAGRVMEEVPEGKIDQKAFTGILNLFGI